MKKPITVSVIKISVSGEISKKELGVINLKRGMLYMDIVNSIASLLPKKISLIHRRAIAEIIKNRKMTGGVRTGGHSAVIYLAK